MNEQVKEVGQHDQFWHVPKCTVLHTERINRTNLYQSSTRVVHTPGYRTVILVNGTSHNRRYTTPQKITSRSYRNKRKQEEKQILGGDVLLSNIAYGKWNVEEMRRRNKSTRDGMYRANDCYVAVKIWSLIDSLKKQKEKCNQTVSIETRILLVFLSRLGDVRVECTSSGGWETVDEEVYMRKVGKKTTSTRRERE